MKDCQPVCIMKLHIYLFDLIFGIPTKKRRTDWLILLLELFSVPVFPHLRNVSCSHRSGLSLWIKVASCIGGWGNVDYLHLIIIIIIFSNFCFFCQYSVNLLWNLFLIIRIFFFWLFLWFFWLLFIPFWYNEFNYLLLWFPILINDV